LTELNALAKSIIESCTLIDAEKTAPTAFRLEQIECVLIQWVNHPKLDLIDIGVASDWLTQKEFESGSHSRIALVLRHVFAPKVRSKN
jgi:hypothetical protein